MLPSTKIELPFVKYFEIDSPVFPKAMQLIQFVGESFLKPGTAKVNLQIAKPEFFATVSSASLPRFPFKITVLMLITPLIIFFVNIEFFNIIEYRSFCHTQHFRYFVVCVSVIQHVHHCFSIYCFDCMDGCTSQY